MKCCFVPCCRSGDTLAMTIWLLWNCLANLPVPMRGPIRGASIVLSTANFISTHRS
jgi:hypothetical protein